MLIVVVGLHVDAAGNLLVQQRPMNTGRGGLWEFPGGKVEDGETMRAALIREWEEELGLHVGVGKFIDEHVVHFDDSGNVLLPLFRVHFKEQTPVARDGQIIRRLPFEEVRKLTGTPTMPLYEPAVAAYLAEL